MLKSLLRGLVVLLLAVGVAHAAWNIKQKDDGTAVWESPVNLDEAPIGTTFLYVHIADLSSAATGFVVSPVTGDIQEIYLVADTAITIATAIIQALIAVPATHQPIAVGTSGPQFTPVSADGGTFNLTPTEDVLATGVTVPAHAAGLKFGTSPTADRSVLSGGIIAISTDGGSTTASIAKIVIIIRPQ